MPPASTNALSAATPASPRPPTYSSGSEPFRLPSMSRCAAIARQDDDVEGGAQAARAHLGVAQRLERELVLLEQPARPALVDRVVPRPVEPDPRRADGRRRRRPAARAEHAEAQLAREALDGRPRVATTGRTTSVPGAVREAVLRHGAARPLHAQARGQQPVRRDGARPCRARRRGSSRAADSRAATRAARHADRSRESSGASKALSIRSTRTPIWSGSVQPATS